MSEHIEMFLLIFTLFPIQAITLLALNNINRDIHNSQIFWMVTYGTLSQLYLITGFTLACDGFGLMEGNANLWLFTTLIIIAVSEVVYIKQIQRYIL